MTGTERKSEPSRTRYSFFYRTEPHGSTQTNTSLWILVVTTVVLHSDIKSCLHYCLCHSARPTVTLISTVYLRRLGTATNNSTILTYTQDIQKFSFAGTRWDDVTVLCAVLYSTRQTGSAVSAHGLCSATSARMLGACSVDKEEE